MAEDAQSLEAHIAERLADVLEAAQAEGLIVTGERFPQHSLEIDTSDADMGASWQDQLAQLEARLKALTQGEDDCEQHVDRTEGMGY